MKVATPRKKRLSESSDRRRLLNSKVSQYGNIKNLLGQSVNTGYKTSSRVLSFFKSRRKINNNVIIFYNNKKLMKINPFVVKLFFYFVPGK